LGQYDEAAEVTGYEEAQNGQNNERGGLLKEEEFRQTPIESQKL
jgi:hypothetical protein